MNEAIEILRNAIEDAIVDISDKTGLRPDRAAVFLIKGIIKHLTDKPMASVLKQAAEESAQYHGVAPDV